MTDPRWRAVDAFFDDLLRPPDPAFAAALDANAAAGLPGHDVSPAQGKLLQLLAQIQGARSILEIGTLGGYSTIWLARGLADGGRVTTLEAMPEYAEVARANVAAAGLADSVEIAVGDAAGTLERLTGPFDLIFIDADKGSNPRYLTHALRLSRPSTVIVADNVVRDGAVADAASTDPRVQGIRRFTEMLAAERLIEATAIQTVGSKGYDGFVLARVSQAGGPGT